MYLPQIFYCVCIWPGLYAIEVFRVGGWLAGWLAGYLAVSFYIGWGVQPFHIVIQSNMSILIPKGVPKGF